MKNIENILKTLRNDLYENQSTKGPLQFFQTSVLHFTICLEIGVGTHSNKYISYEKLCDCIPKKFGSRSTIQNILNDAVTCGYFDKDISKIDRRIKTYKFSKEFSSVVIQWVQKNYSGISNLIAA